MITIKAVIPAIVEVLGKIDVIHSSKPIELSKVDGNLEIKIDLTEEDKITISVTSLDLLAAIKAIARKGHLSSGYISDDDDDSDPYEL